MNWFLLGLLAMIGFTVTFLLVRKIADLGLKSEVFLFYYFAIAAIVMLVYAGSKHFDLTLTRSLFILLLICAVFGALANVFLVKAISTSPNPGYALAVSGIHILLVAVASLFLFHSEFTLVKGIGTILAVIGIILLGI